MKTKYGNAKINNRGYYIIRSKKEGNDGKLLHRLVFEDYHNCKLDENDVIHHIDGDKTNNHPANLICMSQKAHGLLHNKYRKFSEEHKQKLSKNHADFSGKNHPMYGKHHSEESKNKMSESLTGRTHSEETKKKMSKNNARYWEDKTLSDEHKQKISEAQNNSGYFRVCKAKNKKCKQGFTWYYRYWDDGKHKTISSVDINKLEAKVKAKGLKWRKL